MATLMLSQGTPMILAGDELGNSQGGNNNAYCQDNAIGWVDWDGADPEFLAFCRRDRRLPQAPPDPAAEAVPAFPLPRDRRAGGPVLAPRRRRGHDRGRLEQPATSS